MNWWDALDKGLWDWENWLRRQNPGSVSREVLSPFENFLLRFYGWLPQSGQNAQSILAWRTYAALLLWWAESRASLDCSKVVDIKRQFDALHKMFVEANQAMPETRDLVRNLYEARNAAQSQIAACRG